MSLKKFGHNDVILNTMKTHPSCEFFISEGRIFYNNHPSSSIYAFASGASDCVSLYELNINRSRDEAISFDKPIGALWISGTSVADIKTTYSNRTASAIAAGEPNSFILDTGRVYAWQYKDSSKQTFKRISDTTYNTYIAGDVMTSSYPMSASITREFMPENQAGARKDCTDLKSNEHKETFKCTPEHPHFWALKNRLNFYGIRSEHYKVTSSHGNKMSQSINLISIPTIFYGSKIKPGTLSLKWYLTGTLIGELQDKKQNGELIQVSGAALFQDKVAGVVLYDEGFVLLTGSWDLNHETIGLISSSTPLVRPPVTPKWIYFGAGAKDDVTPTTTGSGSFASASFDLSFKGTTETQVMTMFAHAKRGEVNYSNNPTFLSYGQDKLRLTSSQVYEENSTQRILNTVSSSYSDYSASFERQVYVSRVGIYDDAKNLIGVATLSNPILKKENEDFSFKIRLDL